MANNIIELNDILIETEFITLMKLCDRFTTTNLPDRNNHYDRMLVEGSVLKKSIANLINIFFEKTNTKIYINNSINIWINRVTIDSNKNDTFHRDMCDVSIIVYLNDNFLGGELEYIDNDKKIKKIYPTRKNGIIIKNRIKHRVTPVIEGERFSLVMFFNIENDKKVKSII